MRERIDPYVDKERVTLYLPVELYTRVRHRAIELGKTISKHVADLMERDLAQADKDGD